VPIFFASKLKLTPTRRVQNGKLDDENLSMKVAFQWQGQALTLLVTGKACRARDAGPIAADNGYWSTDVALKGKK
jgi:hypothetical protein